jgi:hypothetical protein
VAVENRPRSYVHGTSWGKGAGGFVVDSSVWCAALSVKRMENLPHNREVCVTLPFFPCNFVRYVTVRGCDDST